MKQIILSNFELKLESKGQEHFEAAMQMAFSARAAGGKAEAYRMDGESAIELFWHHNAKGSVMLPYKMDVVAATQFVWNWLETAPMPGNEPDIDGSISMDAFQIVTTDESWNYRIVRIEKRWALYHK